MNVALSNATNAGIFEVLRDLESFVAQDDSDIDDYSACFRDADYDSDDEVEILEWVDSSSSEEEDSMELEYDALMHRLYNNKTGSRRAGDSTICPFLQDHSKAGRASTIRIVQKPTGEQKMENEAQDAMMERALMFLAPSHPHEGPGSGPQVGYVSFYIIFIS